MISLYEQAIIRHIPAAERVADRRVAGAKFENAAHTPEGKEERDAYWNETFHEIMDRILDSRGLRTQTWQRALEL